MQLEQMEPLDKDVFHHFQCVVGMPLTPSLELWVFQEKIAKKVLSQLVVQHTVDKQELIAILELLVHLLKSPFKKKTIDNFQLAPIDLLSTANQSALKVKPQDALKLELQLQHQWETGTTETDLKEEKLSEMKEIKNIHFNELMISYLSFNNWNT